jgi:hypothetical protein
MAVLRKWPLFLNFDHNVVPDFLIRLLHQDFLPADSIFPAKIFSAITMADALFQMDCKGGTEAMPDSHSMRIQGSVEKVERRHGASFLFVIHKI